MAAARAAKPALLCPARGPSSHLTSSFWRADWACHQVSATIAIPLTRPGSPGITPEISGHVTCSRSRAGFGSPGFAAAAISGRSTTNACFTPRSFLIWSRLELSTLPPKTGHFSYTAWSIPGSFTSMP